MASTKSSSGSHGPNGSSFADHSGLDETHEALVHSVLPPPGKPNGALAPRRFDAQQRFYTAPLTRIQAPSVSGHPSSMSETASESTAISVAFVTL